MLDHQPIVESEPSRHPHRLSAPLSCCASQCAPGAKPQGNAARSNVWQDSKRTLRTHRTRYKRAPSFFSLHMGVDASIFPGEQPLDVHHIVLEDWAK